MYIVSFKIKRKILMVSILVLTIFISAIVFAKGRNSECVEIPIVMYHHILKNTHRQGKYVVSPYDFEKDLLYLKNKGYSTVFVRDLVDFVYGNKELPEKPVILTFDDGYESNNHYIIPIIEKHNEKIVISVVGEYSDNSEKTGDSNVNYSYLNWETINKLDSSNKVEIANHTYCFHNTGKRLGIGNIKGECEEEYRDIIMPDLLKLNEKIKKTTGRAPVTFTYPFGKVSDYSKKLIRDIGFKASLSCEEGNNIVKRNDPESLFLLKRYNRPAGISTEAFFKKMKI